MRIENLRQEARSLEAAIERKPPTFDMQMTCGACGKLMALPAKRMDVMEFARMMLGIRCDSCGSSRMLQGQNRTAAEDDGFEHGDTLEDRTRLWVANGETGNAAAAIYGRMTGEWETNHHPHDVSDLRRCILLLRRIPEWESQIGLMADVSPEWSRISAKWSALVAAFRAETTPALLRRPTPVTAGILATVTGVKAP